MGEAAVELVAMAERGHWQCQGRHRVPQRNWDRNNTEQWRRAGSEKPWASSSEDSRWLLRISTALGLGSVTILTVSS